MATSISEKPTNASNCLLFGFLGDERNLAQRALTERGFQITYTARDAALIVVKSQPSEKLLRESKTRKIPILSLQEALSLGGLSDEIDLTGSFTAALQCKPAVEFMDGAVRILDVVLPTRRSPLNGAGSAIPQEQFLHLCLDQTFLVTARNVAVAARHDVPCALEGETATSKTTAVRWVAALLGQPLYRINLNGQTDTGELVGRYVPCSSQPALNELELIEERAAFTGVDHPLWRAAAADLERAHQQNDALSAVERARIAQVLGMKPQQWSFVEGLIPKALRHGAWVVLDEMNLAEPQILERLNSVLEDERMLVLTESDHTSFGLGGDVPSHPEFRMFGTMNPADYAGRSSLSPAFRDRWRLWSFVSLPTESDIKAMLRFLVFGEHPMVEFAGELYQGAPTAPLYPELQDLPEVDELLNRIAIFHYQLSLAAGDGGQAKIGRTRRERYVFTRRSLQTAMKMIHHAWCAEESLPAELRRPALMLIEEVMHMVYLARIQDPSDQAAARSALLAAGLRS